MASSCHQTHAHTFHRCSTCFRDTNRVKSGRGCCVVCDASAHATSSRAALYGTSAHVHVHVHPLPAPLLPPMSSQPTIDHHMLSTGNACACEMHGSHELATGTRQVPSPRFFATAIRRITSTHHNTARQDNTLNAEQKTQAAIGRAARPRRASCGHVCALCTAHVHKSRATHKARRQAPPCAESKTVQWLMGHFRQPQASNG